jgi:hypothetical protein
MYWGDTTYSDSGTQNMKKPTNCEVGFCVMSYVPFSGMYPIHFLIGG